eukprot:gene17211-20472_t
MYGGCYRTKLGIAACLLVAGTISATAPKYMFKMNKSIFSCGNMFASGVLLGAGLCHQLPDATNVLQVRKVLALALTDVTFGKDSTV